MVTLNYMDLRKCTSGCFFLGRIYLSKSRSVCIVDIVTHCTAVQHREPASAYLLLYTVRYLEFVTTTTIIFALCYDKVEHILWDTL